MAKQIPKQEQKQKTPHVWGFAEWKRRSDIYICACGSKYLKTRKGQTTCVRCMSAL